MRIFGHALGHTAATPQDRDDIEARARPLPLCGAPFFQQIAECGCSALLLIDALSHDQTIVYASPPVEELTGYAPDELIGQDWRQFLIMSAAPSRADAMAATARCGSIGCESFTMRHKDAAEPWLDVKLSQLGADPAFMTHYIAVLHRLTDRASHAAQGCREPLAA